MQIKEMFEKQIDRDIKGVIKVGQSDEENVYQELDEYVVTKELLKHFRDFFDNYEKGINNNTDKMGVWISGFFGSGKSHFLKYLDYCITPETRDVALKRLLDAVKEIDPFDGKHNLQFEFSQVQDIASWLKTATIDTCIFNLETSYLSLIHISEPTRP